MPSHFGKPKKINRITPYTLGKILVKGVDM